MLYHQAAIGEPWYLPQDLVDITAADMYSEAYLEKSLDYYLTHME